MDNDPKAYLIVLSVIISPFLMAGGAVAGFLIALCYCARILIQVVFEYGKIVMLLICGCKS
jgi:hypothetical protein